MPTVGGLYLKWRELREIQFCGFIEVFCKKNRRQCSCRYSSRIDIAVAYYSEVTFIAENTYIAVTYNGNIFPAASYLFKINNRNTSQSVTYVQR